MSSFPGSPKVNRRVQQRYQNWFDELAAAADAEWDAQEKQTLSKIAADGDCLPMN